MKFGLFFWWVLFFCSISVYASASECDVSKLIAAGYSVEEIKVIQAGKKTAKEIDWCAKMLALGDSEKQINEILEKKRASTAEAGRLAVYVPPISNQDVSVNKIMAIVRAAADYYGLDFPLLQAVIKAESNFNQWAVSVKGAKGFMQLMPETAELMGVTDILDPAQNIYGGAKYLAIQMKNYKGKKDLALAAYNAGPGKIKNNSIPKIKETVDFVARVKHYEGSFFK
jgi:soluble lytic murein transglycosylase-like protein